MALAAAGVVLVVAAAFGVRGILTADGTGAQDGTSSADTSSADTSAKQAADPDSCGGRINVGADQSDGTDCSTQDDTTSVVEDNSSSTGSDDDSSSDDDSDDSDDDSAVAPDGTLPYGFEGVWEGEVSQPTASVQSWTVHLELKGGKRKPGTMTAIDLGCTSKLTVESSGYVTVKMRAPVPARNDPYDRCASLGEVILLQDSSDSDQISFAWQDASDSSNVGYAVLERVDD